MDLDPQKVLLAAFPLDDVIAALDDWWAKEKEDAALPDDPPAQPDIMKPEVEIDSHRAVRALITLQEVVKIEIPESVIKEGGYDDFDEMKAHLVPQVKALFDKERDKQEKQHA
ncbi:hypothetical protein H9L12_10065 [Sphingomonas rhizophila]|uniref:Uncharacterized protein n=1 Tax=Sphingomonas rhizophila TaxID=2071607 RepID=A0A7G9S9U9_9SPHN|nr:hypothetical protein [Sphingomonas rhizophila]QNN64624.1 hypothetical protein H9L12_10065 [Sphingomonas rhizophila]